MKRKAAIVALFLWQWVFFLALTLFIYRGAWVALEEHTGLSLLLSREASQNPAKYFIDILSATRAFRYDFPDNVLFRPLFYLWIWLRDVLAVDDRLSAGVFSFVLHAATTCCLYSFLARNMKRALAITFSVLFLFQYSGMAMVLWRHISGYMFSLLLLCIFCALVHGHNAILSPWKKAVLISLIFFATLAHEWVVVTLFVLVCIWWNTVTATPLILYVSVFLIDMFFRWPILLEKSNTVASYSSFATDAMSIASSILLTTARYFIGFVFPGQYSFKFDALSWMPITIEGSMFRYGYWIGGIVFFALSTAYIREVFRWVKAGRVFETGYLKVFLWTALFVLILGVSLGRTGALPKYSQASSYYHYLFSGCLLLLLGVYAGEMRLFQIPSMWQHTLLLLLVCRIFYQGYLIRTALSPLEMPDNMSVAMRVAKSTKELSDFFQRQPDLCYQGWRGRKLSEATPLQITIGYDFYLIRYFCSLWPHKKPVQVELGEGGDVRLVSQLKREYRPVELSEQPSFLQGTRLFVGGVPKESKGVQIHCPVASENMVWLLDYRNPNHFTGLEINRNGQYWVEQLKDGHHKETVGRKPPEAIRGLLLKRGKPGLDLRFEKSPTGSWALFSNGMLIDEFEKLDLEIHRVGVLGDEAVVSGCEVFVQKDM